MSLLSILLAALAVILGIATLLGLYLALRGAILVGRPSSFGAWMVDQSTGRWVRGVALYGQVRLAWYELGSFSFKPRFKLPRTRLEVIGAPARSRDGNYTIVKLRSPETTYVLALLPGDAEGLISWVNSAPPGVSAE